MSEPEPVKVIEPVKVAPKRKSQEKTVRRSKQSKISDFLSTPKKAQKRKNSSNASAKKLKNSQAECDRQMEIMANDGIIDLSEEAKSPNVEDASNDIQEIEDDPMTTNDAFEFIQRFQMPTKKVFKFIRPTNKLKDLNDVSATDINAASTDVVGETTQSEVVIKPQQRSSVSLAKNHMLSESHVPSKPLRQSKFVFKRENKSKEFMKRSTNATLTSKNQNKGEENRSQIETKTATERKENNKKKSQDVYVPTCIKAMFGSQTVSQRNEGQFDKSVHKKKDINFRYLYYECNEFNNLRCEELTVCNLFLKISVTITS